MAKTNRKYKDRLFRLIFADEKMKNDLSFIIADTMNLYEQQSTHKPNMPLRGFLYFGSLYENYLDTNGLTLHSNSQVKIPTPNYIVFYNGVDARPAMEKLYLSNAFQIPDYRNEFEWTATVINLNHPDNRTLLDRCKPLSDYTFLVSKIQAYAKTMSLKQAVNKAVDDCIAADILTGFLRAHRADVLKVYLAEVNEEVLRKRLKEEGYDEGFNDGFDDGKQNLLAEQITKKIKAGKPLEQIAEEVEETADAIREFYDRILAEMANQ